MKKQLGSAPVERAISKLWTTIDPLGNRRQGPPLGASQAYTELTKQGNVQIAAIKRLKRKGGFGVREEYLAQWTETGIACEQWLSRFSLQRMFPDDYRDALARYRNSQEPAEVGPAPGKVQRRQGGRLT